VILVLSLSGRNIVLASLAWGALLLASLTWFVARARNANVLTEILKHLGVAVIVIVASRATGTFVSAYVQ
jgi:chromate transport protein ChrA